MGLGLIHMTSFYLNYLFKALSQIQPHSEVLQGVRTSTYELRGHKSAHFSYYKSNPSKDMV